MREQKRFPRRMDALGDLIASTDGFLEAAGAGETAAFVARLAVEELFTNAVRHGVGGRDHVEVALAIEGTRLSVTLTDFDVAPWTPDGVAPVNTGQPLSRRAPGGLGIHILRTCFDTLEWSYTDRNLTITVCKRLEPSDVRSASA